MGSPSVSLAPTPQELARHVAALDAGDRRTFESAERMSRMNALSEGELEAETRERQKGKFAAPSVAAGIEPVSIEWLWREFLPLGALSLLYGTEGEGKSAFTMLLAALVTRGELPGALHRQPASVEIFAYEDDPAAVLVPRLLAAGADLTRVFIHGDGAGDGLLTIPDDVDALGLAIEDRRSKLVIVDPLPDALREGLKQNDNGDVRKGLVPLHRLAQKLGIAVLGVTHPNKGATDPANKVMGSKAWRSVPRAVLLYGRDPSDPSSPNRIVAVNKANYAGKSAKRISVERVDVEGVEQPQPRARIEGDSSYTDADVILANVGAAHTEPVKGRGGQLERAKKLLYRLLEDGGGEIEAKVARAAGEAAGLPEATMRRARQDIGATPGRTWTLDLTGAPL